MAKSPIYARGRNRKHKHKQSPLHPSAANVKMRGKKEMMMSCGYCVCLDMRAKIIQDLHKKELNTKLNG